jgi:hypothetical protein
MSIEQILLESATEIYEHRDIIKTVIDAIVEQKVDPARIRILVEQEITRMADEEMRREFPIVVPVAAITTDGLPEEVAIVNTPQAEPLPDWLPIPKP